MGTFGGGMTMPEDKGRFLNLTYSQHINGLMLKRTLANIQLKNKRHKEEHTPTYAMALFLQVIKGF